MKTKLAIGLLSLLLGFGSHAQNNVWKNRQAAVALTYDDALNIHLDKVVPQLDSFGFKGTFYIIGSSAAFTNRLNDWRKAAGRGHELGNHTLFHPCAGNKPGREWVKPDQDLSKYTVQRAANEVMMNNALLEAVDGKKKRSMACPCGESSIGDSSYLPKSKDYFVATRDGTPDANAVNAFKQYTVQWTGAHSGNEQQLVAAMKKAIEDKALLIIVFHGVGGEHPINISLEAHRELLRYIKQNESKIWVAPFVEIAEWMQAGKK
jgi:peptidoglycan/xylan/chitin deacetylase (PgdA/CDA1 family)